MSTHIRFTAVGMLALLALTGCGGSDEDGGPARSPAADSAVTVIRAWSDTLRHGDVKRASSYFALPAIVANGTVPVKLSTRAQVRAFNASLPCGAKVVKATTVGRYTNTEFVLTERPGPGRCGSGTGERARVAFVVRDGKIREWRRAATGPEPAPEPQQPREQPRTIA